MSQRSPERKRSRRRFLRALSVAGVTAVAGCATGPDGTDDTDAGESPVEDVDIAGATLLALGDSYTAGTGVDAEVRWVGRLAAEGKIDHTVVADGGWLTTDLAEAIDTRDLAEGYDAVTLQVGANDAFQAVPAERFASRFRSLHDRAVALGGGEASSTVLMTIPDYTVTPFGEHHDPEANETRVTAYNEIVREIASDRGARLVDLAPLSRRAESRPELIADDGLHPSAAGHELFLDRIVPAVAAAVEA